MKFISLFTLLLFPFLLYAQQQPDTTFSINIKAPAFTNGDGPTICIDSAHNNFHTVDGGYAPFARVMKSDGYLVEDFNLLLENIEGLSNCDIFMIVNPLYESNVGNWVLPNPSAFTEQEIQNLNSWVKQGGSFFLIADHMPFAGAANELGRSFGFEFSNGFATPEKEQNQPDLFTLQNGRLQESPVSGNEITSITSFTGSAFTYPENAIPVMVFTKGDFSLEPEIAWRFEENTKNIPIEGYAQGALLEYGLGKIAVFGEAAMFTAQTINTPNGPFKIGLNNTDLASQNLRFLLNIMHWLDDETEP